MIPITELSQILQITLYHTTALTPSLDYVIKVKTEILFRLYFQVHLYDFEGEIGNNEGTLYRNCRLIAKTIKVCVNCLERIPYCLYCTYVQRGMFRYESSPTNITIPPQTFMQLSSKRSCHTIYI